MKKLLLISILLLSVAYGYAQVNLDSGLVLHYPFNGNANDTSVNQIHGTLMNGPVFTSDHSGNPGKALLFDGIDDYVLCNASPALDTLNVPYTISTWLRIDGWYIGSWASVISKSNVSNLHFRVIVRNTLEYYFAPYPTCNDLQGSNFPSFTNWFYLTIVHNTNTVKAYINGVLANTFSCPDPLVENLVQATVGRDDHGSTEYYIGALDELRIYKRALLPSEIGVLTGIDELNHQANNFIISPNPVTDMLTVQFNKKIHGHAWVEISNTLGQSIHTEKINDGLNTIDVRTLPAGTYFLRMMHDKGTVAEKFIKL